MFYINVTVNCPLFDMDRLWTRTVHSVNCTVDLGKFVKQTQCKAHQFQIIFVELQPILTKQHFFWQYWTNQITVYSRKSGPNWGQRWDDGVIVRNSCLNSLWMFGFEKGLKLNCGKYRLHLFGSILLMVTIRPQNYYYPTTLSQNR